MVRVFPLVRTGQPEWSVHKWSVPFLRSGSTNSWRNVSAILKKFEELVYNQTFKLENSIAEMGSTNSWKNISAILKKFEELVLYNQAFKLENSITELTFLAGQF